MSIIYTGKTTAATSLNWAWAVLSTPFYFACWYGATPETTWAKGSSIRISISPKMQQFDEIGIVTQFVESQTIGFKVFKPSFLLPNIPENQIEAIFTLSPQKEKVEINLLVQTEIQNIELLGSMGKVWKKTLAALKKTMEDKYLYASANL